MDETKLVKLSEAAAVGHNFSCQFYWQQLIDDTQAGLHCPVNEFPKQN